MDTISQFLLAGGKIPEYVIFFIVLLPVVATLVSFVRQVIGIEMFNAYAPIIATYAFLGTGMVNGLAISIIVLLAAILFRSFMKKVRLHYLPRMSLLITLIAICILILLPLSTYVPILDISNISVTSIVLFIVLSEIYLTTDVQKGYKEAGKLYVETIVVASLIFLLINWSAFRNLLISYPEVIVVFIIINLILGRWKGLRLTEIYRFRSIIKQKAKDYA